MLAQGLGQSGRQLTMEPLRQPLRNVNSWVVFRVCTRHPTQRHFDHGQKQALPAAPVC